MNTQQLSIPNMDFTQLNMSLLPQGIQNSTDFNSLSYLDPSNSLQNFQQINQKNSPQELSIPYNQPLPKLSNDESYDKDSCDEKQNSNGFKKYVKKEVASWGADSSTSINSQGEGKSPLSEEKNEEKNQQQSQTQEINNIQNNDFENKNQENLDFNPLFIPQKQNQNSQQQQQQLLLQSVMLLQQQMAKQQQQSMMCMPLLNQQQDSFQQQMLYPQLNNMPMMYNQLDLNCMMPLPENFNFLQNDLSNCQDLTQQLKLQNAMLQNQNTNFKDIIIKSEEQGELQLQKQQQDSKFFKRRDKNEKTPLNTSHVPINMMNNIVCYLIKLYNNKIPCKCPIKQQKNSLITNIQNQNTDIILEQSQNNIQPEQDAIQLEENQQKQNDQSPDTQIPQNQVQTNNEEKPTQQEDQNDVLYQQQQQQQDVNIKLNIEQNCDKCSRCQELEKIMEMKKSKIKNIKSFQNFWSSPRLRCLSEQYFLQNACFQILNKKYRSNNNRQALFECLPAFLQGVRNHQKFWKLI